MAVLGNAGLRQLEGIQFSGGCVLLFSVKTCQSFGCIFMQCKRAGCCPCGELLADVLWCCLPTVQPAERREVGVAGGRCFLAAMPACYPKMA